MYEQVIYALVDPVEPDALRYIGRTNEAPVRYDFHAFNPHAQDVSPRGLWGGYLHYAGRSPELRSLEHETFEEKEASEVWAKDRERHWIRHHREAGEPLLNRESWWPHPSRSSIPAGVRYVWEQTHNSLFWFDFVLENVGETLSAIDQKLGGHSLVQPGPAQSTVRSLLRANEAARDHDRGRDCLLRSIESLAAEYPSLAVAPVQWIAKKREARWCFDERAVQTGK